jgi:hypothetical protein
MVWRERLRHVVDDDRFQRFIVAVIVLNAVTLGLETSERVVAQAGWLLHAVDGPRWQSSWWSCWAGLPPMGGAFSATHGACLTSSSSGSR